MAESLPRVAAGGVSVTLVVMASIVSYLERSLHGRAGRTTASLGFLCWRSPTTHLAWLDNDAIKAVHNLSMPLLSLSLMCDPCVQSSGLCPSDRGSSKPAKICLCNSTALKCENRTFFSPCSAACNQWSHSPAFTARMAVMRVAYVFCTTSS